MKLSRPSPSMAVAGLALFVSLGGTSVAAVNYAREAGAVDGKSAVSASGTVKHAAGRLVATNSAGPQKGMIPGKYLADVPHTQSFGRAYDVADNAPGAPQTIATVGALGTLSAACNDQAAAAGVEDPIAAVTFANTSGASLNVARRVANNAGAVGELLNQTVAPLTIAGSNTFSFHLEAGGVNVLINGMVRQDGRATPNAHCLVVGTVLRISG